MGSCTFTLEFWVVRKISLVTVPGLRAMCQLTSLLVLSVLLRHHFDRFSCHQQHVAHTGTQIARKQVLFVSDNSQFPDEHSDSFIVNLQLHSRRRLNYSALLLFVRRYVRRNGRSLKIFDLETVGQHSRTPQDRMFAFVLL